MEDIILGDNERASKSRYRHPGMHGGQRMKVMGIERNILETIDLKYFYPSEYVNDPYNLGKNYKPHEIFEMLYDAEEPSKYY